MNNKKYYYHDEEFDSFEKYEEHLAKVKAQRIMNNPSVFNKCFRKSINEAKKPEDIAKIRDKLPSLSDINKRDIHKDANIKSCKDFLHTIRKNNQKESLIIDTVINFIKNMKTGNQFTQDEIAAILEQVSYKIPNWNISGVRGQIKILTYGAYNCGLLDMNGPQTFKTL